MLTSTPTCSIWIAVVWRMVCGETRFFFRLGYAVAATRTANDSRFATAERDIATPLRVGSLERRLPHFFYFRFAHTDRSKKLEADLRRESRKGEKLRPQACLARTFFTQSSPLLI